MAESKPHIERGKPLAKPQPEGGRTIGEARTHARYLRERAEIAEAGLAAEKEAREEAEDFASACESRMAEQRKALEEATGLAEQAANLGIRRTLQRDEAEAALAQERERVLQEVREALESNEAAKEALSAAGDRVFELLATLNQSNQDTNRGDANANRTDPGNERGASERRDVGGGASGSSGAPPSAFGTAPSNWTDDTVTLTKGEAWELRAFALQAGADKLPDAYFINSALDKLNTALDAKPDQDQEPHCGGSGEISYPGHESLEARRQCSGCEHPDCPNRKAGKAVEPPGGLTPQAPGPSAETLHIGGPTTRIDSTGKKQTAADLQDRAFREKHGLPDPDPSPQGEPEAEKLESKGVPDAPACLDSRPRDRAGDPALGHDDGAALDRPRSLTDPSQEDLQGLQGEAGGGEPETDRARADRLEVECRELEDANRSLARMRDAALKGNLATAQPDPEEGQEPEDVQGWLKQEARRRWPGVPGRWLYRGRFYGGNPFEAQAPGLAEAAQLAGETGRVVALEETYETADSNPEGGEVDAG